MIKTFSTFVFRDIWWKLLSLCSSVILCIVVTIIVNPIISRSIPKPITFNNEDVLAVNDFIIINRDEIQSNVQLSIRGRHQDMDRLRLAATVSASVDLSRIDESFESRLGEPITLPIHIEIPAEYRVMNKDPESISIIIDRVVSEPMPVSIEILGEVEEGFEKMSPMYEDTVQVTAPKAVLESISNIRAIVDLDSADEVVVHESNLYVYDNEGNDITEAVTLSFERVQIRIPVYPVRVVPIRPRYEGNPQRGFWLSGDVTVSPETITVYGPAEVLDGIEAIELSPVELYGATSNVSVDFDILDYMDPQLSLSNNEDSTVNVTVYIEEEVIRRLTITDQNIRVISDNIRLVANLPREPIPVTLRGPADVVRDITSGNLRAELDISGLSTGVHDIILQLNLPSVVSVTNAPISLRVIISNERSFLNGDPGYSTEFPPSVANSPIAEEILDVYENFPYEEDGVGDQGDDEYIPDEDVEVPEEQPEDESLNEDYTPEQDADEDNPLPETQPDDE